jgi:hypothetical protein
MDTTTSHFHAWCAGFFDGEGHVSIYARRRRWGDVVYVMRVGITQKTPTPLHLLVKEFGGFVSSPNRSTNCHRW